MNKNMKDMFIFDDDKIYAEAKKQIEECRKKKSKKLDLSSLDLKEIPPEIAELKSLEELNITCGSLEKVPGFIGSIVSLKKLLVGHKSAHGKDNIILPAELGNLCNLQNLSLGYNIPEIPPCVFTLDNLEALSVFNNSAELIPAAIANIKKLRKLRIYGEKISELPKEIGEKLSLTALDLKCPQLKTLPDSFANLKTLKAFVFDRCNLTAIPGYICGWTELEELKINMDSTFQGPYTKLNNMPKNIGNLKKLIYLNLDSVNIKNIPDSLGNCPLQYLELWGSFSVVPETLGNCSKLDTIKLCSSKPISLPNNFGKLSSLNELEIRAPALKIPESFGNLSSLEDLTLSTDDLTLPKSFGGLRVLKEISIDSVNMSRIPDSIGNCKNLRRVFITSDKLTILPESFYKLKKLEDIYLKTFALKTLPASFGNLTSLKFIDIFSGALTSFPESMSTLKKLTYLNLDAHNVKELPASFKKFSCVKDFRIEIGQKEPILAHKKGKVKKNAPLSFEELSSMSWQYRKKLFESYSIKQLETLICSAPTYPIEEKDREVFKDIMVERYCKIKNKFKWTEENKKRIAKVSDEFIKAWEEGFTKAKTIIEALYEKEQDKSSFNDKYFIDLILHPEFLFDDDEYGNNEWKLYDVITQYLKAEVFMNIVIKYDPVTKDESNFRENHFLKTELSWNIEGFGDIDLQEYYISYALHELYSHNDWAFSDIPKINSIRTEIQISRDGEKF